MYISPWPKCYKNFELNILSSTWPRLYQNKQTQYIYIYIMHTHGQNKANEIYMYLVTTRPKHYKFSKTNLIALISHLAEIIVSLGGL